MSFGPPTAGRGRSRERGREPRWRAAPRRRAPCPQRSLRPCFPSERELPLLLRPGRIRQMLITDSLSLRAMLAPALIAIYILQRFTLGREPTLMVPSWQHWAVKRRTICCLLSGAWSALVPTRVHVCARARAWPACVSALTCTCRPLCAHISVCDHTYVWVHTGARGVRGRPWVEGARKEGSGHLCSETPPPSQGRPCRLGPSGPGLCHCPPGPAPACRCPREAAGA